MATVIDRPIPPATLPDRPKLPYGLNQQQWVFCREYVKDLNAARAAVRAGYKPDYANKSGYILLDNPGVCLAIDQLLAERAEASQITAEKVLCEIARIAFADVRQLFDQDGSLRPITEWTDNIAAAVSSIEFEELYEGKGPEKRSIGRVAKVKLWDKAKALDQLGKHLQLFQDNLTVGTLNINVQRTEPALPPPDEVTEAILVREEALPSPADDQPPAADAGE